MKLSKEITKLLKDSTTDQKISLIIGIIMCGNYTEEDILILDKLKTVKFTDKANSTLWNIVSRSDNILTLKYGAIFCK